MLTGADHWALEQTEAHSAAKAIENVARHYPNVAASQKIVDFVMLIQALGFVYGPRIMVSMDLKKEREKENRPVSTVPNVSPFMGRN